MKKHSIGTVVNFCTNESRFIGHCLDQALIFSSQVVVPVANHFFDGSPENRALLEEVYQAFPECLFIEYPFIPDEIPKAMFHFVRPEAFWHCFSRLIGFLFVKEQMGGVLFLDADEIAEGQNMAEWLDCSDYEQHTVLKFANYWYFREPTLQAESLEDSILFVKRRALAIDMLLDNEERNAIYDSLPGPKRRMVLGVDGNPLFHHFSWVRTKEEMLKKVQTWGHRNDRNWQELVQSEFEAPFKGTDFIHGYRFRNVPSKFTTPLSFAPKGKKNVVVLGEKQVKEFVSLKKISLWRRLLTLLQNP